MAIIKLRALERLAEIIGQEVKELRGNICAGPATRDHKQKFPSLALVPERFSFMPHQADATDHVRGELRRGDTARTIVFEVGTWQGTIACVLGEKTPRRRYALEYQLEQIFLGNVTATAPDASDRAGALGLRPGILLVDLPDCYNARCAFELEDDTWENEKVFSNQWFSTMRLTANIPALVPTKNVPTIDQLQLSLTEDLETIITTPAEADALADIETVDVALDGSIS